MKTCATCACNFNCTVTNNYSWTPVYIPQHNAVSFNTAVSTVNMSTYQQHFTNYQQQHTLLFQLSLLTSWLLVGSVAMPFHSLCLFFVFQSLKPIYSPLQALLLTVSRPVTTLLSSETGTPSIVASCEGGNNAWRHVLKYGTKSAASARHMRVKWSCSWSVNVPLSTLTHAPD